MNKECSTRTPILHTHGNRGSYGTQAQANEARKISLPNTQIVQTTANRIMEIVPGGQLIDKITTYDVYLESDEMARKRQTYSVQTEEDD